MGDLFVWMKSRCLLDVQYGDSTVDMIEIQTDRVGISTVEMMTAELTLRVTVLRHQIG